MLRRNLCTSAWHERYSDFSCITSSLVTHSAKSFRLLNLVILPFFLPRKAAVAWPSMTNCTCDRLSDVGLCIFSLSAFIRIFSSFRAWPYFVHSSFFIMKMKLSPPALPDSKESIWNLLEKQKSLMKNLKCTFHFPRILRDKVFSAPLSLSMLVGVTPKASIVLESPTNSRAAGADRYNKPPNSSLVICNFAISISLAASRSIMKWSLVHFNRASQ